MLLRIRETPHQLSLPRERRIANVRGAFALEPTRRPEVVGRSIGLIDDVIPEPAGGAHRNPKAMAEAIQHYVVDWVRELQRIDPDTLVRKRYEKFRAIASVK
jgi:hypothetical protein